MVYVCYNHDHNCGCFAVTMMTIVAVFVVTLATILGSPWQKEEGNHSCVNPKHANGSRTHPHAPLYPAQRAWMIFICIIKFHDDENMML